MEIELNKRTLDELAHRVAIIVTRHLREDMRGEFPKMVTTAEAAQILRITPGRMRQIADRYPHIKQGDSKQAKLLFVRDALLK